MGKGMKKYGVDGKKRFTIRYPDGTTESFGTCDPNDDERMAIEIRDGLPFLVKYERGDLDYSKRSVERTLLPKGTLVANGYYDYEWDEFVSPHDFTQHT